MSAQELTSRSELQPLPISPGKAQYNLWQVLGSGWLLARPCGCWVGWLTQF